MARDPFEPISDPAIPGRWDLESGFWPAYAEPKSHVADLVQKPSYLVDGYTLAVAFMRDWRKSSRRTEAEGLD